jgi:hypothetical protein
MSLSLVVKRSAPASNVEIWEVPEAPNAEISSEVEAWFDRVGKGGVMGTKLRGW